MLKAECDNFDRRVKVGDAVDYYSHPNAEPQRFTTRTNASVLSGHTAVVWLEGKSGCVALRAIRALPDSQKREESPAQSEGR
jgi:hypothetical protein